MLFLCGQTFFSYCIDNKTVDEPQMPHDDIILTFYGTTYDIAPDVAQCGILKFIYAEIKFAWALENIFVCMWHCMMFIFFVKTFEINYCKNELSRLKFALYVVCIKFKRKHK